MDLIRKNKGQGLVEYMIIVALMAVSTMGIIRILSQTTNLKLASITQSLQGGKASLDVQIERVEKTDLKKKDMSNFFQGSRSRKNQ